LSTLINDNGDNPPAAVVSSPTRRRTPWPLIILATLFIVVPFLTWYGTWFGRTLSDEEIAKYVADDKNPRHIQHALARIEERIEAGDPSVKKFYPQVVALTRSPVAEIRKTTAWVMGQDNTSEEFHKALVPLLGDSEPLVRRNAALQLVRFGDGIGRPELRAMLQPFEAKSSIAGTIASLLAEGSKVTTGGLIARIRDASNTVQEFRSPVDGAISRLAVKEGDTVATGQTIVWLIPDRATVNDALRGLAYVGTSDDVPLLESYAKSGDAEIRELAAASARAIGSRSRAN